MKYHNIPKNLEPMEVFVVPEQNYYAWTDDADVDTYVVAEDDIIMIGKGMPPEEYATDTFDEDEVWVLFKSTEAELGYYFSLVCGSITVFKAQTAL